MDYSNGSGDRCAWDFFLPPNEGNNMDLSHEQKPGLLRVYGDYNEPL